MAAERRKGKQGREELQVSEPDLLPIMNIIFMLILVLISIAAFLPLGVITTQAPKLSGGAAASSQPPKDEKPPLGLTIFAVKEGFNLRMFGKLYKAPEGQPDAKALIPVKAVEGQEGDTEHDFEALHQKLLEIKKKNPQEEQLIIMGHDDFPYSDVIRTMDASRMMESDEGGKVPLFPMVVLGAGIF
ncbi:MAG: biopolymer transporter ExbD [Myxococcota bacterium]